MRAIDWQKRGKRADGAIPSRNKVGSTGSLIGSNDIGQF